MKLSIYLHRQIVDVLSCYGSLDEVVNKILEAAAEGKFDVMDKPPCPGRDGAGRYEVQISEPSYLELLSVYSPFSPRISIRRVIYWFVENEIYNELGWVQTKEFLNRRQNMLKTKLANSLSELEKSKRYCSSHLKKEIEEVCERIKYLQELTENG